MNQNIVKYFVINSILHYKIVAVMIRGRRSMCLH